MGEKIRGRLFKSGGQSFFISGNVPENASKVLWENRRPLEITRSHLFETSGRLFYR